MQKGCYPAIRDTPNNFQRQLLQNYFNSIVASDFIFRNNESNPAACKFFLKSLITGNASPFTYKKTFNTLRSCGFKISEKHIPQWYEAAMECYLSGVCTINSVSPKKISQNYRKTYITDWAMAKAVSGLTHYRLGRNLETAVYWHLVRNKKRICYTLVGSHKFEIDFLISDGDEKPTTAIQVCAEINEVDVVERELRGFNELNKLFPGIEKIIITAGGTLEKIDEVSVIPAVDWFL